MKPFLFSVAAVLGILSANAQKFEIGLSGGLACNSMSHVAKGYVYSEQLTSVTTSPAASIKAILNPNSAVRLRNLYENISQHLFCWFFVVNLRLRNYVI